VLFRNNYAMLATVFAGAFGFQMYAPRLAPKQTHHNVICRNRRS
jgi:hypothetical protein